MKKLIVLLILSIAFLGSTAIWAEPPGGFPQGPFQASVNWCAPEDISLADARQYCEDEMAFWLAWDVMPPVVVTHCPKKPNDKGKKPAWTPNGHCELACLEGEVQLNCVVKKYEAIP